MKKTLYVMMMAALVILASCSKNNEQLKENKETLSATISESKLIGKWELTSLDWISYKSTGQEDYRTSYISKPDDIKRTWITFNSNKTYIHSSKDQGSVGIMLADAMPLTAGEWILFNANKSIKIDSKEWSATKFEGNQMTIEYNQTASNGTKSKIILLFTKD